MKKYIDLAKRRIKLNFNNYNTYIPKYNYLKALMGVGLIGGCCVVPFTLNVVTIPIIFAICVSQRPLNIEKLKESKYIKPLIRLKLRLIK